MFEFESGIIFWNTVSFLILVFVMYRWALPPLMKMLRERGKMIADSLAAAAENQKKSEELLSSAKQKIAEVSQSAQKIVNQAMLEGEQLKEEIISASKKEAEFLMIKAKEDLQREKNDILSAIRTQTADLIIAAANRVLGKKIDKAENERLVEESIKACQR